MDKLSDIEQKKDVSFCIVILKFMFSKKENQNK